MKKALIAFGFAFFLLAPAFLPARAIEVNGKGIKAGLSLADMTGDDIEENKMRLSFAAGGFVSLGVSEGFSVQPELLFVQKGTKWSESGEKIVFRLSYIEVPILAKYSFAAGSDARIFVFAGPAVAFKVGAIAYYKNDESGESESNTLDGTKGFDFGLAFGGGVEIPFRDNILTVDLRYTLGLTNCLEYVSSGEDLSVKNGAFLILAGIGF